MKYLILALICSMITVFAYAEEDSFNPLDPNVKIDSGTQGVFLDQAHAATIRKYDIKMAEGCPNCAQPGPILFYDENGNPLYGAPEKAKTNEGEATGTQDR